MDSSSQEAPAPTPERGRTILGIAPLKWVFALEYVMQGLANPFQGMTYQPFFRHLRMDYGLSEAATQGLFAKSYLAWSFKPVLGFLIDAYGRTRTILIALLATATLGFALTPVVDTGPLMFFGFVFALSIVLAATDVAVDRATVISGHEEAAAKGQSKATAVGLNQSICWTAIYGTSVVAAVLGGYVAEHLPIAALMPSLGLVPLVLLGVVLLLPRDRALPIPVTRSIGEFWRGLNSGPILAVMLFYFIFHFQPAMGALWNNYLLETLKFSQTEVGISDGATWGGAFVGVLLFAWKGVHLQDRLGLRKMFRIYILASIVIGLTQYVLVDPWFSAVARGLSRMLPFWDERTVRLIYLSTYNALLSVAASMIRMTTFSLVGAVIPVGAAGSLFAGFMSVANLAYAFAYSSGAWLYEHGMRFAPLRAVQADLFGIPGGASDELSVQMLILVNSLAFLLSFLCVHLLPDRRDTLRTGHREEEHPGPERWKVLDPKLLRALNTAALGAGVAMLALAVLGLELDVISAVLMSFFGVTMLRKWLLDALLRRRVANA